MDYQLTALTICAVAVAFYLYKRCTTPISDVPGPKNPSWIHGHYWWWHYEAVGDFEKKHLEEYGAVFRWNAMLGEERLWIADPKAVHHVLQGSSALYQKLFAAKELIASVVDKSIVTVEGDAHKRQRRAMTPAFGLVEVKALYPYFVQCTDSLMEKWHEIVSSGTSGQDEIINVYSWLSRATLDAIGAGAFDYDFGAVEGTDNKFTKSYANLVSNAFGRPSKGRLFFIGALKWTPKGFTSWMVDRGKSPAMITLRENKTQAFEVATKLVEKKRQELKDGTAKKDLLSLLVKANSEQRSDFQLSEDEIINQFRTFLFAGHENITKTLSLALWELAKNRRIQERLRAEIMEAFRKIKARGDSDFTANDFESMPYLVAVGKETLRMHPTTVEIQRMSKEDNLLPLSKPIIGISGKVYNELLVPAGTVVAVSTLGYNLNKGIWGPDAYEFRPERWLEMSDKPQSPFGIYGNLATFSGGPRGCIGWRFVIVEMHTFLVKLLRQFDFALPDSGIETKVTKQLMVVAPVVAGEEAKGPQVPLKVTILGSA